MADLPNDPLASARQEFLAFHSIATKADQVFAAAREAVRGYETFRAPREGDRRRIESVLFSPYPEWER